MNDPERLLRSSAGGLPARLVRAGAAEAPSKRSIERTLAALGAAATTLGTTGAAGALGAASAGKVATTLTLVGLVKWAGVGLASGVVVSLATHVVGTDPAPRALITETRARVEAPTQPAASPTTEAVPPVSEPVASTEPPRHVATAAPVPSEPVAAPLAAEVRLVDQGRAAFQRGDANGALAVLERYETECPERRLLQEVLYLRMEARAASGDRAKAEQLARVILRDFGKGPHAARARALLAAP
jgi:hypothetical protein